MGNRERQIVASRRSSAHQGPRTDRGDITSFPIPHSPFPVCFHQLTWSRVSFTTAARRSTQAKRVNTNVRSETHRNRPQGRGEGCEPPPASCGPGSGRRLRWRQRAKSEEHTSELQSLMRTSYAVFCLKKTKTHET